MNERLARIETELAARNLVGAYADIVDGRELSRLAEIFVLDMVVTIAGHTHAGLAAVTAFYEGSAEADPTPRRHFVVNTRITDVTADSAVARSSFMFTAGTGGRSVIGWGRYRDVFARTAQGLKFVEKHIEIEFRGPIDEGWATPR